MDDEELERKRDYLASWHAEIPQRTHTTAEQLQTLVYQSIKLIKKALTVQSAFIVAFVVWFYRYEKRDLRRFP